MAAYRRAELAEKIKAGQAVLLKNGQVVTNEEDLPSEIDLAGDDLVRASAAIGDMEAQAAKLKHQIDEARAKQAVTKPKEVEVKDLKAV